MMRRQQLVVFFSAVLLFALGAAAGLLAHRLHDVTGISASEDWRTRYVKEMHSRLQLDPKQLDTLNDILDETRTKVHAVKDRYRPELIQIKQEQIAKIKMMLTPQQSGEYDKVVAEHEQKAKAQDERDRQIEQQRAAERKQRSQARSGAGAGR
jgi:uncharacterized membrane protein